MPYWFGTPGLPFGGFPVFRLLRTTAVPCSRFRGAVTGPPRSSSCRLALPFRASPRANRLLARAPACAGSRASLDPRSAVTHPLRRRTAEADNPLELLVPSALTESGIRFTRATHRPPRSGLSVSHALAGFRPPKPSRACFVPVTLLGFRLQGLSPLEEPIPSREPFLSCRSPMPADP